MPSPSADGAFYLTGVNVFLNAETGYVDCIENLHIDAARSSSIYGNASTVIPNSVSIAVIIYLGS